MSKISKIAVPGVAEPYDIEAYKALSIPFGQVDSTSTDTAYTAQIDGITSLYDGVCVYLKNGVITSNKNGFTLNVNGLGAKPVYGTLAAATRSGTVFNVNYTMLFVYNSSRVSGGCWDIFYGYNSDTNTLAYNVRVGATPPTTSNKLVKYGIAFTKTDGHLLSSNTTGTTATSKALTAIEFDPFAPIYYYPTTAVAANGSPSATYLYQQYSTVDFRYAFNSGSTLVIGKPIYVRCVPQTDGTVKLDGNNCIVQELPTVDDNKVYIYLGYAYGTYQIFLDSNHPVYCIRDGRREFWHGDKHYWTDIIDPPDKQDSMFVGQIDNSEADDYVTPAQILAAFNAHKDICITYTDSTFGVLKFTSWNTAGNGYVIAANAILQSNGHLYVYDLHADTPNNNTVWVHQYYALAQEAHSHDWSDITDPPLDYTPSDHTHDWNEIENTPTEYPPTGHGHVWGEIANPPATYTPSSHEHSQYALLASPSFSGIPTAPTPAANNSSTQIANTGWVKDRIDGLGTVFNLKGTKTNAASLPTSNNTIGDVWYVTAESVGYIWLKDSTNVERWEKFGEPISLPATYTPSPHTHTWNNISDPPSSYTPSAHTHTWANISNPPSSYTPSSHTHAWANISNPPTSYTPSTHTHSWANISNTPSSYTPSAHTHAWSEITNTPATYTPSTHTHSDLAPINSPQFTGTPTAPSPNSDNNSTAIANTAWVNAAISSALAATDFITEEDLPATYTPSAHTHTWANISNPPASYTPSSHTHSEYALINSPQFTGTPTAPDIDIEETPTYSQIATKNWVNQKVITVLTITAEEIDRDIVYTYEPNLSLTELQELAENNRLQLIYNDAIYPFVRYYTWRPGTFGPLFSYFEFSRIQYESINDLTTYIPVTRLTFEYDDTNECFSQPNIVTANLITDLWHDQYTVQDTTLIIGDIPQVEESNSPTPDPDGER